VVVVVVVAAAAAAAIDQIKYNHCCTSISNCGSNRKEYYVSFMK
jgi:hypothetical protein